MAENDNDTDEAQKERQAAAKFLFDLSIAVSSGQTVALGIVSLDRKGNLSGTTWYEDPTLKLTLVGALEQIKHLTFTSMVEQGRKLQ